MTDETNDNVVKLAFIKDIPGMMRLCADDIEKGKYGKAKLAAFVLATDDDIAVFGWGDGSELEVIGLFTMAAHTISDGM